MGSKYVMQMDVGGNAEAKLEKIAAGVGRVKQNAASLEEAFGRSGEGLKKLDTIASATKAGAMTQLADSMHAVADSFESRFINASHQAYEFASDIVKVASEFQDVESDMQFAFGSGWEAEYTKVKSEAIKLNFTFKETAGLAASLGRMKISPFGDASKEMEQFKAKTGESISALNVLQDTASAAGKGTDDLVVAMRAAMAGDFHSLEARFDIPRDAIHKWKAELTGVTDKQKQYNLLIQHLSDMFGGASKLKEGNLNFLLNQIPDAIEQIKNSIGRGALEEITKGVKSFGAALAAFASDKAAMATLSEAFRMLGVVARAVLNTVAWLITYLQKLAANPAAVTVMKIVVALGLLGMAITGLLTLVVGFGAAVATTFAVIATLIAAVGFEVIAASALITLALLPIMAALAVLTAGLVLTLAMGARVVQNEWGDGVNILTKIKVAFKAIMELFENYKDGASALSADTAEEVKAAGMTDFVKDAFKLIRHLDMAWQSLSDTWDKLATELAPMFKEAWDEIKVALKDVADALGLTDSWTKANNASGDDWVATGVMIAQMLAKMIILTLKIIIAIAWLISVTSKFFQFLKDWYILHAILVLIGIVLTVVILVALVAIVGVVASLVMLMAGMAAMAAIILLPVLAIGAAFYGIYKLGSRMGLWGEGLEKGANKALDAGRGKYSTEVNNHGEIGMDGGIDLADLDINSGMDVDAANALFNQMAGKRKKNATKSFLNAADEYANPLLAGKLGGMDEITSLLGRIRVAGGAGDVVGTNNGSQAFSETNATLDQILKAVSDERETSIEIDGEEIIKAIHKTGRRDTGLDLF